ncbi:anthranilate synthase component II [[Eubacterium] hominis]|uniref:anthranilate synthase component II n=1 Tax=[Eubacterium] hominis TaxID=2764325 RepID=UPI003A4E1E53
MILIIDNYDSFTYNLVQYVGAIDSDIIVKRNDEITVEDIMMLQPEAILFSPGPGHPSNAGNMEAIIQAYHTSIPMLGICLGHQAICEVFQANIAHAKNMMHGERSTVQIIKNCVLFDGLKEHIIVGRYHSLIVEDVISPLEITALSMEGEVMAIQHQNYPVYGVQFHPESLLTPNGQTMLSNFIRRAKQC